MFRSIGFVGGGQIARILLGGWKLGRALPEVVRVSDPGADSLEKLVASPRGREVRRGQRSPGFLRHRLPGVAADRHPGRPRRDPGAPSAHATLVSLAPKVPLAKISELAGGIRNVARVIPNAPSIVGEGYNPVACSGNIKPEDTRETDFPLARPRKMSRGPRGLPGSVRDAHRHGTDLPLVSTRRNDAPRGNVRVGRRRKAAEATYRMAAGAAKTLRESGLSPEEVIDLVPVKPLSGDEEIIREIYRSRLSPLYRKLMG